MSRQIFVPSRPHAAGKRQARATSRICVLTGKAGPREPTARGPDRARTGRADQGDTRTHQERHQDGSRGQTERDQGHTDGPEDQRGARRANGEEGPPRTAGQHARPQTGAKKQQTSKRREANGPQAQGREPQEPPGTGHRRGTKRANQNGDRAAADGPKDQGGAREPNKTGRPDGEPQHAPPTRANQQRTSKRRGEPQGTQGRHPGLFVTAS